MKFVKSQVFYDFSQFDGSIFVGDASTIIYQNANKELVFEDPSAGILSLSSLIGGGGTGGTGDVGVVGTPAVGQVAVWVQDASIEGTSELTYSGGSLNLGVGTNDSGQITSGGTDLIRWLDTAAVVYLADLAVTIEPTPVNQLTINPTTLLSIEIDGSISILGNLLISSTGLVSNLNADRVDSLHASDFIRSNAADNASGAITFSGSNIQSAGSLRFNDNINAIFGTGSDYTLDFNGTHFVVDSLAGTGADILFKTLNTTRFTFDQGTFKGTATDWIATSDIRLKENIRSYGPVLDNISKIKGSLVHFDWINGNKNDIGMIAQEIKPYFPEFVQENAYENDGSTFMALSYNKMSGIALAGIAELRDEKNLEIKNLRKELLEVKKELNNLKILINKSINQ